MKKTTFADETQTVFQDFFSEEFSTADEIAVNDKAEPEQNLLPEIDSFLDKLLSVIKWIFLYLPGVGAIHIAMMGVALLFFYNEAAYDLLPGMLGFVVVGTFLIMLGFGKLNDLKYLKTVLTILAVSFVTAVFWDILAIFIKGDFLGFYAKLTFPLIAFVGYFSKISVDNEAKDL
jgi:hypothetical protein